MKGEEERSSVGPFLAHFPLKPMDGKARILLSISVMAFFKKNIFTQIRLIIEMYPFAYTSQNTDKGTYAVESNTV